MMMSSNVDQSTNRYTDQLKVSMLGQADLAINRLPVRNSLETWINWNTMCMELSQPACEVCHIRHQTNEKKREDENICCDQNPELVYPSFSPFIAPGFHSADLSRMPAYFYPQKFTVTEIHATFCHCRFFQIQIQIASWLTRIYARAHNLCHDNRQLIVLAINCNHSAIKNNCN